MIVRNVPDSSVVIRRSAASCVAWGSSASNKPATLVAMASRARRALLRRAANTGCHRASSRCASTATTTTPVSGSPSRPPTNVEACVPRPSTVASTIRAPVSQKATAMTAARKGCFCVQCQSGNKESSHQFLHCLTGLYPLAFVHKRISRSLHPPTRGRHRDLPANHGCRVGASALNGIDGRNLSECWPRRVPDVAGCVTPPRSGHRSARTVFSQRRKVARYCVGVRPVRSRNAGIECGQVGVADCVRDGRHGVVAAASSSIARSTLIRRSTARQVMPHSSSNRRARERGARPTSLATSSNRTSSVSTSAVSASARRSSGDRPAGTVTGLGAPPAATPRRPARRTGCARTAAAALRRRASRRTPRPGPEPGG